MCMSNLRRSERIAKVWVEQEYQSINDWYYAEHRSLCESYDSLYANGKVADARGESFDNAEAKLESRYDNKVDALIEKAFGRGISFEIVVEVCGYENADRNRY